MKECKNAFKTIELELTEEIVLDIEFFLTISIHESDCGKYQAPVIDNIEWDESKYSENVNSMIKDYIENNQEAVEDKLLKP